MLLTGGLLNMIKDSGQRREFPSGAVRDMSDSENNPKGRCDLIPTQVMARCLADTCLMHIAFFMEDYKTEHLYDALECFSDKYYDCMETMFLEVAIHFFQGCEKYGEDNWRKGIPEKFYIDSTIRHYLKMTRGDTDEPHDRAFVWNLLCCIWEVDYHGKTVERLVSDDVSVSD